MKEFWNERYRQNEFAYGEEPNEFLKEQLAKLQPGSILFPAEGEGRNAVYAAQSGWQVSAFDISEEGKKKAERLKVFLLLCWLMEHTQKKMVSRLIHRALKKNSTKLRLL